MEDKKIKSQGTGMAIVLVLLILGLWTKNFLYFKISLVVLLFAMIMPLIFYPFSIFWFGLAGILGAISITIFLFIIFFCLILPIGLFRKFILKKDSMNLSGFKKDYYKSAFKDRNHIFHIKDITKPF